LVKIPQCLCKTTSFLLFTQKLLCSQRPVLVHVSLNDNEQLLTPFFSGAFQSRHLKCCLDGRYANGWGRKYANTGHSVRGRGRSMSNMTKMSKSKRLDYW